MSMPPSHSRLLVIEDNPQMAEVLEAGLQQDDVQVQTASQGLEALALVRQQKFDLVILDLGLPGFDGMELLRAIKGDATSAHLPVIVVTGRQGTDEKLCAFELGATDYVTKPFQLVELRARVRSALRAKRLQDELSQANEQLQAKTEFLARTSHEIRTQLGAVTAMTGLLLQTELTSQQRGYAETIFTSGDSLLALLNDILNVSKIESGKLELEKRPFHVRLCLDEALDLLAAQCAAKNLDLICEVAEETPEQVVGDVTRLRQVLINLISNAVKFTSAGEVAVEVGAQPLTPNRPDCELRFAVRDTGPGISPDRLSRLFQSFSQADSSISRQYGGTGLGLFISKGLVELMGGRLWAESVEGAGSTFHFTIPVPTAPDSARAPWQGPQPQLAGRRALVVDDNQASGRMLVRQLQRWGIVARTAESGWQALEWLRIDPKFDLLLIDAAMPQMDGRALAREIRKFHGLQRVPIVFLALLGAPTGVPEIVEPGLDQILTKPIKPALLHSVVMRSLNREARMDTRFEAKRPVGLPKLDAGMAVRCPLRILLTDDNVINQKVAGKMLNQLGYRPDIAQSGREAVSAVESQSYDVVLMDVQMPGMDGLEATRRIRQHERATGARPAFILAMTANAMLGDREKCLEAGMDEYLPKPFKPEALQRMLEQAFQRSGATVGGSASPSVTVAPRDPPAPRVLNESAFDLDRLLDFADGSPDNLAEIIDLYLRQTGELVEKMRRGVTVREVVEVARLAHTCAGGSSLCGIETLVPLVRELEQNCREHSGSEAAALLERIEREFDAVTRFLLDYKERQNQAPSAPPLWSSAEKGAPVMAGR